jgi:hypothetical protein
MTLPLELYPPMVHEGEISRDVASGDIDDLCQQIHDACKGFGTNEKYVATMLFSLFHVLFMI